MVDQEHQHDHDREDEVIRRNIERSREVIEARKRSANAGKARKPSVSASEYDDDTVAGQWDVPAGGTSSPNTRGGSSKRQKPG